ncbi:MAG: type II toxin-antitoxin system RelE/ParE family toxin [Eikenella sp.]|nr:type II toxin-antitoxin system RelE/ParE family toxin [Eikenella sp.]
MSYQLSILPSAKREWDKLDGSIKRQFKSKLAERLREPRIPSVALHMPDCYTIKLSGAGCRLVYRVDGERIGVTVLAIGKRERLAAYRAAAKRAS